MIHIHYISFNAINNITVYLIAFCSLIGYWRQHVMMDSILFRMWHWYHYVQWPGIHSSNRSVTSIKCILCLIWVNISSVCYSWKYTKEVKIMYSNIPDQDYVIYDSQLLLLKKTTCGIPTQQCTVVLIFFFQFITFTHEGLDRINFITINC